MAILRVKTGKRETTGEPTGERAGETAGRAVLVGVGGRAGHGGGRGGRNRHRPGKNRGMGKPGEGVALTNASANAALGATPRTRPDAHTSARSQPYGKRSLATWPIPPCTRRFRI
jgi:hypothetical protein